MSYLSAELCKNGVNVILDQWDLSLGADAPRFMEDGVRRSDRVLVVCTHRYVQKFDQRTGGVGYESMIVTGELIRDLGSSKFIPLIRQEGGRTERPLVLQSRVFIDFSGDELFTENLLRLSRELHGVRSPHRPPLGRSPFSERTLLIPRDLTDVERDTFLEAAFERMAESFSRWADLLQGSNPHIVTRFKRLDARQFCAVMYRHGCAVSRCRVRLNLGSRGVGVGITYSSEDSDFSNAFDECLSATADGPTLCLRPLTAKETRKPGWTPEEAAQQYWARLLAPLQGC